MSIVKVKKVTKTITVDEKVLVVELNAKQAYLIGNVIGMLLVKNELDKPISKQFDMDELYDSFENAGLKISLDDNPFENVSKSKRQIDLKCDVEKLDDLVDNFKFSQ